MRKPLAKRADNLQPLYTRKHIFRYKKLLCNLRGFLLPAYKRKGPRRDRLNALACSLHPASTLHASFSMALPTLPLQASASHSTTQKRINRVQDPTGYNSARRRYKRMFQPGLTMGGPMKAQTLTPLLIAIIRATVVNSLHSTRESA